MKRLFHVVAAPSAAPVVGSTYANRCGFIFDFLCGYGEQPHPRIAVSWGNVNRCGNELLPLWGMAFCFVCQLIRKTIKNSSLLGAIYERNIQRDWAKHKFRYFLTLWRDNPKHGNFTGLLLFTERRRKCVLPGVTHFWQEPVFAFFQ